MSSSSSSGDKPRISILSARSNATKRSQVRPELEEASLTLPMAISQNCPTRRSQVSGELSASNPIVISQQFLDVQSPSRPPDLASESDFVTYGEPSAKPSCGTKARRHCLQVGSIMCAMIPLMLLATS
eukprot:RCo054513